MYRALNTVSLFCCALISYFFISQVAVEVEAKVAYKLKNLPSQKVLKCLTITQAAMTGMITQALV